MKTEELSEMAQAMPLSNIPLKIKDVGTRRPGMGGDQEKCSNQGRVVMHS